LCIKFLLIFYTYLFLVRRSEWPLACWDCGLESHRGHACLLWVLCVLSGRVLCDGLITRPEKDYQMWSVVMCAVETGVGPQRPKNICSSLNDPFASVVHQVIKGLFGK